MSGKTVTVWRTPLLPLLLLPLLLLPLLFLHTAAEADAGALICTEIENGECVKTERFNLSVIDGHEVNYTWTVRDDEGRELSAKTVSVQPFVVEVENFLARNECEHLIQLAWEQGIETSSTTIAIEQDGILDNIVGVFWKEDLLPLDQVRGDINEAFDIVLEIDDYRALFSAISLHIDEKDRVRREDLLAVPMETMQNAVDDLLIRHPEKKVRHSSQAWIHPDFSGDAVVERFKHRLSALTEMPVRVFAFGTMQAVQYVEKGHYFAHHDSSFSLDFGPPQNCCPPEEDAMPHCQICRYLTLLVYLTDVEEGGETAFPFANSTWNDTTVRFSSKHRLEKNCSSAGLVVRPAAGKAILWYNHFPDPHTGGLGGANLLSWHGGCPVIRGEKWIANFWMKIFNTSSSLPEEAAHDPPAAFWEGMPRAHTSSDPESAAEPAKPMGLAEKKRKKNEEIVEKIRQLQRKQWKESQEADLSASSVPGQDGGVGGAEQMRKEEL